MPPLLNLIPLDDDDLQTVSDVVRQWCNDHGVALDSERARAVMCVAVDRALAGEKSRVALSLAVNAANI